MTQSNLNDLYREGVAAKARGDLETAVDLWQQVLKQETDFRNGTLAREVQELERKLRPARIRRSHKRAKQAYSEGRWQDTIDECQDLLKLKPKDEQAKTLKLIAEHNQKYMLDYENAQQFVKAGDMPSAKVQLQMLWRDAPYYGDPANLAKSVGARVPVSYEGSRKFFFWILACTLELFAILIGIIIGRLSGFIICIILATAVVCIFGPGVARKVTLLDLEHRP